MKTSFLFSTLLISLLCAVGMAAARPIAITESRIAPARDDSELHERMETIEEILGKLRRSLRDTAKRDESISLLAAMQKETLACKSLVPELVETQPAAQQAALKTGYRRLMVDFLTAQLELEAALLDGDEAGVKAAFRKVRDMEDAGHERFTEEEE